MSVDKSTIEDLKKYLINCIDEEGIIDGKRRFSLQLGMLENELFNDMDKANSSIYNFSEYFGHSNPENANLEELPVVVDGDNILTSLSAVSL